MNRLNQILKSKGVSQAHISRELEKSANTINNWCRNETQPTLPEAAKLAKILGVGLEELLDQNDTKDTIK